MLFIKAAIDVITLAEEVYSVLRVRCSAIWGPKWQKDDIKKDSYDSLIITWNFVYVRPYKTKLLFFPFEAKCSSHTSTEEVNTFIKIKS